MSDVKRIAGAIAAAELFVLAAVSPALLFPTPARLLVLVVVPVLWTAAHLAGGRAIPRTPLNAAVLALLVMVAVSLFATFDVLWSLGKVAGVILGVLFFWGINRWIVTEARLRAGLAVFLAAGGVLAVLGLVGSMESFKFAGLPIRLPTVIRGVPGAEKGFNPNAVSGCLVLFVPLQIALMTRGRWWKVGARGGPQWWGVVAQALLLLLTGGTLILMQSRAAWIGIIAAAVGVLAWRYRVARILALAGAVVFAAGLFRLDTAAIKARALEPSGSSVDYAIAVRLELWSRALEGIREYPITGMGMNAFRALKPVRFPIKYPAYLAIPDEPLPHAHNHLLQAAVDLGIPGLIAYLAIWIAAGRLLWRTARDAPDGTHRLAAEGLAAGLVAHFIFSMADAIPLGAKVGILFWAALALTTALCRCAATTPVIDRAISASGPRSPSCSG